MSSTAAAPSSKRLPGSQVARRPVRRVLQVYHSLGIGGAETWLVSLLEWLAQNGDSLPVEVQVEICLTGGERAILDDRVEALGAKLHYLRYQRRHLVKFTRDFRRLLSSGRYDVIHDHADYTAGLHMLCGVGELPPVRVVHIHNPLATFDRSLVRRVARFVGRKSVAHLASTVAGTSMHLLREYRLAPKRGVTQQRLALYCGFDLTPFSADASQAREDVRAEFGWSTDSKILLFVGRLESHFNQKNPRVALDIARECIARDPHVKALFVGAGDEARRQIENELEAQGIGAAIRLPGIRFDVPHLMLGSDLLLFPSLAEGLGMVAVEAQAAGLRVLTSDTTPRECEVIPGMVTFVSLGEPVSRWADRALGLLKEPAPDREASRNAVNKSPFSISSSAMSLLDIYGFGRSSAS